MISNSSSSVKRHTHFHQFFVAGEALQAITTQSMARLRPALVARLRPALVARLRPALVARLRPALVARLRPAF